MSVVLVGRREEKLNELGASIKERFGVDYKVIRADFADSSCTEKFFKETEGLDMGFMSYVACFLHSVSFRILPGRSMKP